MSMTPRMDAHENCMRQAREAVASDIAAGGIEALKAGAVLGITFEVGRIIAEGQDSGFAPIDVAEAVLRGLASGVLTATDQLLAERDVHIASSQFCALLLRAVYTNMNNSTIVSSEVRAGRA